MSNWIEPKGAIVITVLAALSVAMIVTLAVLSPPTLYNVGHGSPTFLRALTLAFSGRQY